MAVTAPGRNLTPKAFAFWTYAMTLILAISLWGVLQGVGPVGFAVVFVPTLFVVLALSWPGRWDRLLPAALATSIVGLWPLYRWLADGDVRTAKAYLVLAGMIDGALLLAIALDFAKRRGWAVDSPLRRRISGGFVLAAFASTVLGWPTGVWRTGFTIVWGLAFLTCLFWPSKRRSSLPDRPVTA